MLRVNLFYPIIYNRQMTWKTKELLTKEAHVTTLQKDNNQSKAYTLTIEKYYVHNIFTIFSQKILSGKLLLVVIGEVKK